MLKESLFCLVAVSHHTVVGHPECMCVGSRVIDMYTLYLKKYTRARGFHS